MIVKSWIINFFLISFMLSLAACNNTTSKPLTLTNKIYYYPQENIYYDESTNNFHYSLDSGHTWQAYKAGEKETSFLPGEKIEVFPQGTTSPWEMNATHISTYHGNLISVVSADTGRNKIQIATAALQSKKAAAKQAEETQPADTKKPGFLKKLFGKKKKKN